jgi:hypothetical protein
MRSKDVMRLEEEKETRREEEKGTRREEEGRSRGHGRNELDSEQRFFLTRAQQEAASR